MDNKPRSENSIERHHQNLVIDTLLAGAVAGFLRDSLLYPVEVYQFARHLDIKVKLSTFTKGAMPAVIGAIPGAAAFITTYSVMKVHLSPYVSHERQYLVHMASAFAAELMSLIFKVPLDNIKKRHMTLRNQVSTLGITKRMKRSAGIGSFYKGFPPAVLTRLNANLLALPLWEEFMDKVKEIQHVEDLTPFEISMCGAIAAGLAGGFTTPLHVAKTHFVLQEIKDMEKEMTERMELKRIARERLKHNIREEKRLSKTEVIVKKLIKTQLKIQRQMIRFNAIMMELYVKRGLGGLYVGWVARTAQITLGGFLFFYTYALVMEQLEDIDRSAVPCVKQQEGKVSDPSECPPARVSEFAKIVAAVRSAIEIGRQDPEHEDPAHTWTKEEESGDDEQSRGHMSRSGVRRQARLDQRAEEEPAEVTLAEVTPAEVTPAEVTPPEVETHEPSSSWGWFSKEAKKPSGDEDVTLSEEEKSITDDEDKRGVAEDSHENVPTGQPPSEQNAHGGGAEDHKILDEYLEIVRNTALWLYGIFIPEEPVKVDEKELDRTRRREELAKRRATTSHHDYDEHEPVKVTEESPAEEKAVVEHVAPWLNPGWLFGKMTPLEDKEDEEAPGGEEEKEEEESSAGDDKKTESWWSFGRDGEAKPGGDSSKEK